MSWRVTITTSRILLGEGAGVRRLTTVLDLGGLGAIAGGVYVIAGLGVALVAAGVLALLVSWRLSR